MTERIEMSRCQCGTEYPDDDDDQYLCPECRLDDSRGIKNLLARRDRIAEQIEARCETIGTILRRYKFLNAYCLSFSKAEVASGNSIEILFEENRRCNDRYRDGQRVLVKADLLEGPDFAQRVEAFYKAERERLDHAANEKVQAEAEKRRIRDEQREREAYLRLKEKFEGADADQA